MRTMALPLGVRALGALVTLGAGVAGAAPNDLSPEWLSRLPAGASLTAGVAGIVVDAGGVSYVTGTTGTSSNTDITTGAFAPDGSLLWSKTFNGPADWHDQARGIGWSPSGVVYVTGNTPGPGTYANVLLLAYDAATGNLLDTIQYSSGPTKSEHGASVAVDAAGHVYVAGGTTGDGGDALLLAFDASGDLLWKRTWDGPARAPYSQDTALKVLVGPDGNPAVLIHGVMSSLHPDYVVVKYAAAGGATIWQANWGVTGEDSPSDMEIDAAGDVYVTGTGLDLRDKFSTIKLDGGDGDLLWQAYDAGGVDDSAYAVVLDGRGGVYVTGRVDPDGNRSNFNDNFYTVKRDAADGAQLWTHLYGANCLRCYDVPSDVNVDAAGNVFVAGSTSSPPYSGDAILMVLDAGSGLETQRGVLSGGPNENATWREIRFDSAFNVLISGVMANVNTGGVDMSVAKYASLAGGAIPCGDLSKLIARCVSPGAGNKLQARLTMADGSHDGESVTFEVDGATHVVSIDRAAALLVIGGISPGSHTVELTDPAGCFTPKTPVCPAN